MILNGNTCCTIFKNLTEFSGDGVYEDLLKQGYTRSLSGMVYAAKRMGLGSKIKRKAPRKNDRRFPECLLPGEKVQIDVKEVPFNCLKKSAKINEKLNQTDRKHHH